MPDRSLTIHLDRPDALAITVEGVIDFATVTPFVDVTTALLDEHPARLILDLAGVPFMTSTGLSALVKLRRHADQAGTRFDITNPRRIIRVMITIAGLNDLLGVPQLRHDVTDAGSDRSRH